MPLYHNRQRGISLLEVMLSVSIIAIILIMATRYYFVASDHEKVNTARQQIGVLIAGLESWEHNPSEDADIGSLSISTFYKMGWIPASSDLINKSGNYQLLNPWHNIGGMYNLNGDGSTTPYTITVTLPSNGLCLNLRSSYPNSTCDGNGKFTLAFNQAH